MRRGPGDGGDPEAGVMGRWAAEVNAAVAGARAIGEPREDQGLCPWNPTKGAAPGTVQLVGLTGGGLAALVSDRPV